MRLLLIHNRFRFFAPITWLSLLIRMFTCSKWNHLAIEVNGQVWESIGKGVIRTPWDKWVVGSDRVVLPLTTSKELKQETLDLLEGQPYGFLDLAQIALHIIRTRWFAIGHGWNGKDGTKPGWFCSELGGLVLEVEKPWLLMPCDFPYLPGLVQGEEFETKRK